MPPTPTEKSAESAKSKQKENVSKSSSVDGTKSTAKLLLSSVIILSFAIVINLISAHFNVKNHYLSDVVGSKSSLTKAQDDLSKESESYGKPLSLVNQPTMPTGSVNEGDNKETASNSSSNERDVNLSINEPVELNSDGQQEEKVIYSFLATAEQDVDHLSIYQQPCSPTGYRYEASIGSAPKTCGVTFTDYLVDANQVNKLRSAAGKYIELFGESTTTNRESYNLQWINLHTLFRKAKGKQLLPDEDYNLVINASIAAKSIVSMAFGIPEERLYFTTVCQFTRYEPVTSFSEFRHIDKVRSPELIITSILWLSTVDDDFSGGRLEFLNGPGPDKYNPFLIEPKKGRYAAWTSSHENPHGVHELYNGERLALIFAFTANPKFGHSSIEKLRTWATLNGPSFYY